VPRFVRIFYTVGIALVIALHIGLNCFTLSPKPVFARETYSTPPTPTLIPPTATLDEVPLGNFSSTIPDVLLVFKAQPLRDLAAYLKTTPEQLLARNPGLPDTVPIGAIVVIPDIYQVTASQTLSAVANETGLPVEQLIATNPDLTETSVLTKGIVLRMPRLHIVYQEKALSAVADEVQTSTDVMLSANPELMEKESVQAGEVLVVPIGSSPTPTPTWSPELIPIATNSP